MTDRRQQIVDAASAILAEEGAAAISVRAVAHRAGIGASTLRHYFPSQRALLDAVFAGAFDGVVDDLRIRDAHLPARTRLAECLRQFLPLGESMEPALAQWFDVVSSIATAQASPERRAAGAAFTRQAQLRVMEWLRILKAEGAVPSDDHARDARLLLAVIDGLALSMLLPDNRPTIDEAAATMDDAVAAIVD